MNKSGQFSKYNKTECLKSGLHLQTRPECVQSVRQMSKNHCVANTFLGPLWVEWGSQCPSANMVLVKTDSDNEVTGQVTQGVPSREV